MVAVGYVRLGRTDKAGSLDSLADRQEVGRTEKDNEIGDDDIFFETRQKICHFH